MSRRDPSWWLPDRPDHPAYLELLAEIEGADAELGAQLFRESCLNDFWFFARHCLSLGTLICRDPANPHHGKRWLDHPWLFDRCREIQAEPDGNLDLWGRYHFKTALVTQSQSLWDLADNPELRILIVTYKLDTTGVGFLVIPQRECENNEKLKAHFPDVFWRDPREAAAAGAEWNSTAMTLRRRSNAREPSLMVCGLIANLPTSYHFDIVVWDDIVIEKNGFAKELIESTNESWRKATGLDSEHTRHRMTGTHWGPNDTYRFILDLGAIKLRHRDVYLEDGTTPALHSAAFLEGFKLKQGSYHFAAQMRNDPLSENAQTFHLSWADDHRYEPAPIELKPTLNRYIFIDSATTKKKDAGRKKGSDYTVIVVVGVARGVPLPHFFVLDMIRDRLSLTQTTEALFALVEQWEPLWTFQEELGAQRDVEHYKHVMLEGGTQFRIRGFYEQVPKEDRIRRLQPVFEAGRYHLPKELPRTCDGRRVDMVRVLLDEEYKHWTPEGGSRHDDMLDALAWPLSPVLKRYIRAPAKAQQVAEAKLDVYQRAQRERRSGGMVTGWAM